METAVLYTVGSRHAVNNSCSLSSLEDQHSRDWKTSGIAVFEISHSWRHFEVMFDRSFKEHLCKASFNRELLATGWLSNILIISSAL